MARSHPEEIDYINHLKFGSQFNYTPEQHGKVDIESDDYLTQYFDRVIQARRPP